MAVVGRPADRPTCQPIATMLRCNGEALFLFAGLPGIMLGMMLGCVNALVAAGQN